MTLISLNPQDLQNDAIAFGREWLVTNGIGGYASASVGGANTRRYHGLLVGALKPPLGRAVLLSKMEESLVLTPTHDLSGAGTTQTSDAEPQVFELSANLYPDGVSYPQGNHLLESWQATPTPTWIWKPMPGLTLEKRIWMLPGRNTTCIAYRLLECPPGYTAGLHLVPLLAWKDYHSEMRATDAPLSRWETRAVSSDRNASAEAGGVLRITLPRILNVTDTQTEWTLRLAHEDGTSYPGVSYEAGNWWYYRLQHPRERERGQDYQEDLYAPGVFRASLDRNTALVVVAEVVSEPSETGTLLFPGDQIPESALLISTEAPDADSDFETLLKRAASQFLVCAQGARDTIVAGYPWFSDWGRDTMISLPGLCLTTGQAALARDILSDYARHVESGMLPNRFPDVGSVPEYNTVDATLWYFVAIYRYIAFTGDVALLRETLWNVLETILTAHRQGTRYNIHVDEADHLLYAGQAGVQLTWMDAKVGNWVVTPRIGKPVEINALWHNALAAMAQFAEWLKDTEAKKRYQAEASQVRTSFLTRFARPDGKGLYDVLDTPPDGQPDAAVRPNQVFALSLPFAPLDTNTPLAASVIAMVADELYTPVGLRTLSPQDPAYRGRYEGDSLNRDGAYHQGTVWPWLLGSYAEAYFKVHGDREAALNLLRPLQSQLSVYGMGSLAEVYDGDEPRRPNGCIAQAWSVAETLRVWQGLKTS